MWLHAGANGGGGEFRAILAQRVETNVSLPDGTKLSTARETFVS